MPIFPALTGQQWGRWGEGVRGPQRATRLCPRTRESKSQLSLVRGRSTCLVVPPYARVVEPLNYYWLREKSLRIL